MILNTKIRSELRKTNYKDSHRLFCAVWRNICQFNREADIDDLDALYDIIASSKVNNPKSSFYIYG